MTAVSHLVGAEVGGLPFLKVLAEGEPKQVGQGKLFTYSIYAERGLEINKLEFGYEVDGILRDKRGWIRGGKVAFQRVNENSGTQIILARPHTVDKLCAPLNTEGKVSCCQGTHVVVNFERWTKGVPHWFQSNAGTLHTYRQMLINHEMGHRIGHSHAFCPGMGQKAPVMQQQTYGFQGCRRNSWPLDSEL
jgi:hypothetical protein